jgi:hypothetical protein
MRIKTMRTIVGFAAIAFMVVAGSASAQHAAETIDTRIGKLSFTHDFDNGYPTDETQQKLLDEMDFQRASQAYLWSIPIVGFAQWEYANTHDLGAVNGQIVFAKGYDALREGLTANTTTPYSFSWTDLTTEPWIVEIPKGTIRGAAHNIWQIGLSPMTKAGKYLFVGPENKMPSDAKQDEYIVVKSDSNNVMQVLRLMSEDPKEQLAILKQIKIYPYSERANPKPRGYITPDGKRYRIWQPRGMAYWELLASIINREPVQERDRFFMAMLKPLGIEKGKPFKPNASQTKILKEAVLVGEAMAKANDFANPRMESAFYVKDSHWEYATTAKPDQRFKYYDDLDGRAKWLYEALTNNMAMHGQTTGKGQIYMSSYKDADGDWLDGGQNYVLHVPANVPAKTFWAFNVYDVSSRTPILNKTRLAGRSSRMDLNVNADGTVDIYTGPEKPAGDKAKNWIQTVPGKGWFTYFRLYSPEKAFLDKTWILPDIDKLK